MFLPSYSISCLLGDIPGSPLPVHNGQGTQTSLNILGCDV